MRREIADWDIRRKIARSGLQVDPKAIGEIVKIIISTLGHEHSTEALRLALRRDESGVREALRNEDERTLYRLTGALEMLGKVAAEERAFRRGRSRLNEVTEELHGKRGSW